MNDSENAVVLSEDPLANVKHVDDLDIDDRHILFLEGMLAGKLKVDAYIDAGFSPSSRKSAGISAAVYLKRPEAKKYLQIRRAELRDRVDVSRKRIVEELARVAFADIRDVMSWDEDGVHFIPSSQLHPHEAAAIHAVKMKRRVKKNDDGDRLEMVDLELKMHPKLDAIEKLNKMFGNYQADRMNDADVERDLMKDLLYRFVASLITARGYEVADAVAYARKYPEEVEEWAKAKGLLKPG